jgi:hypothetical protein
VVLSSRLVSGRRKALHAVRSNFLRSCRLDRARPVSQSSLAKRDPGPPFLPPIDHAGTVMPSLIAGVRSTPRGVSRRQLRRPTRFLLGLVLLLLLGDGLPGFEFPSAC